MAARKKTTPRRRTKAYREFVSEAEEILERMRDDLADLADRRAKGADADPELVNRLFRSAHSLKGLSGMFGLDGVSELSHHLEDVLDGLRMGRTALDASAVSLLEESVALVAHTLEIVAEPVGGAHVDPDATGEALREALIRHVTELRKLRPEKLVRRRAEKYAAMGVYSEA